MAMKQKLTECSVRLTQAINKNQKFHMEYQDKSEKMLEMCKSTMYLL